MLTLRQRIFTIVSIVVTIVLAILLYLIYGNKPKVVVNNNETTVTNPTNQPVQKNQPKNKISTSTAQTPVQLPPYSEDMYVRQLTKVFVERLASYSNQNDNQNIADVLALATPTMRTWIETQTKPASRDYQGVTTVVLASHLKDKTATTATVTFEAQQTIESKKLTEVGATKKQEVQKKGNVKLVKVGSDWKVDGLFWE